MQVGSECSGGLGSWLRRFLLYEFTGCLNEEGKELRPVEVPKTANQGKQEPLKQIAMNVIHERPNWVHGWHIDHKEYWPPAIRER